MPAAPMPPGVAERNSDASRTKDLAAKKCKNR
jgi:hypothetical protein